MKLWVHKILIMPLNFLKMELTAQHFACWHKTFPAERLIDNFHTAKNLAIAFSLHPCHNASDHENNRQFSSAYLTSVRLPSEG